MVTQNDDGKILYMPARREATVEDLYRYDGDGRAELVNGELVVLPLNGDAHGQAELSIIVSLHEYARRTKRGRAVPDSVAYLVRLRHRRSFCPDGSFFVGPSFGAKFIEGAPVFAVEVRSPEDYGPVAERRIAAKRADYFAAGTLVVWDVDVLRDNGVRVFRATDPDNPTIYRRGDAAEAEPAVPGWTFAVEDLFLHD